MARPSILDGSNDQALLEGLYELLEEPANKPQEQFRKAWEISGFISGDGFEWLFEQGIPMEEFEQLFSDIGFHEAVPYIRRAAELVPKHLLLRENEHELFPHIHAQFDAFKKLFLAYLKDAQPHLLSAFGAFVRRHKEDFAEPLSRMD